MNNTETYTSNSCGIDCSGLAGTAFNQDNEKLMDDFNIASQNANAMKEAFRDNINGELSTDFSQIQAGDLVFNNFNGNATHIMVATGNYTQDIAGSVLQVEVMHAPQTGDFVKREYRNVGANWSLGHPYRPSDFSHLENNQLYYDSNRSEFRIYRGGARTERATQQQIDANFP